MRTLSLLFLSMLIGLLAGCRTGADQRSPTAVAATVIPRATAPTERPAETAAAPAVSATPTPTVLALLTTTPTRTLLPEATATPARLKPTLTTTQHLDPPLETPVSAEISALAAATATDAPVDDEALVSTGLQVYKQQYCGICHQLDMAGTKGLFGPVQNEMGKIAEERIRDPGYSGSATTAGEYIRESIIDPSVYLVEGYAQTRHHMPAFTHLTEAELEALVQMLVRQR